MGRLKQSILCFDRAQVAERGNSRSAHFGRQIRDGQIDQTRYGLGAKWEVGCAQLPQDECPNLPSICAGIITARERNFEYLNATSRLQLARHSRPDDGILVFQQS